MEKQINIQNNVKTKYNERHGREEAQKGQEEGPVRRHLPSQCSEEPFGGGAVRAEVGAPRAHDEGQSE